MPLQLPNLDDRKYKDLVEEARRLIPTHAPDWTNHNPSDPGITLVELFAYLAEMMIYRLNRVTDDNRKKFLKLLKGSTWTLSDEHLSGKDLNEEIRKCIQAFRRTDRAVTCKDFEILSLAANPQVARVRCAARRNLESGNVLNPSEQHPGHVSVIIVPRSGFACMLYRDAAYTDFTAEAASEGGMPFGLVRKSGNAGGGGSEKDFLYLGYGEPFNALQFRFAEKGRNYLLTFEYFDGAVWKKLAETVHALQDSTANWMFDGQVTFTAPADWTAAAVNNVSRFWLRISTASDPLAEARAYQIVPKILQPGNDLRETVRQYLEPRRLLTAVVHVVGPRYLTVGVRLTIVLQPDALEETVRGRAIEALWLYLHPLIGAAEGTGWLFGRDVYVSEIYALLDRLPGVNYVKKSVDPATAQPLDELVVDGAAASRLIRNAQGDLVAVELQPDELVDADIAPGDIKIETTKNG